MQTKSKELIKGYEQSLVKIILNCVSELPFSFGKKKIVGVLRGSKSSYVIDHKLYQLDMYGILPDFKVKYLYCVLEKMQEQGLLEVEMVSNFGNRPTLTVTQAGKDFLDGKSSTDVDFATALSNREITLLNDQEQVLFDDLRQLRRDLASEQGLPAFMICGNICLREVAKTKPKSEPELLLINGIGESFVHNYGNDFLGAIELFDYSENIPSE